jgi:hypothetical protein
MRYTKPQVVTTCRATANIQNVGAQKGQPLAIDSMTGNFSATNPAYSADE